MNNSSVSENSRKKFQFKPATLKSPVSLDEIRKANGRKKKFIQQIKQGGKIRGSTYEPPSGMFGSIKNAGRIQGSDHKPPPGLLGSKKVIGKLKKPDELQQPAICPPCNGSGRKIGWNGGRYYATHASGRSIIQNTRTKHVL